jgi:hypothetical protein
MASRASSSSQSTSMPMAASTRDLEGYTLREIPPFVQYTSPVFSQDYGHGGQLPLNLVARIVSYLDDAGDLARVTRTSRLLYYMALPQLYERVALHSYPVIRYVDGRPEGFGSGSPFMMALNGLATKTHATVVKEFRVWGEWRELGQEEFAKGRVPDNSMMLSMMLRTCVERMTKLRSFSWELDCKPLKTLYQGLTTRDTLTYLTIKFPSSRTPRPSICVPPMQNLKGFAAIDIDPLCYPDDISHVIAYSPKLIDLRLHFAPRMRRMAEPSLNMEMFFGQAFKSGKPLKLKHVGGQNWFGRNTLEVGAVMSQAGCDSMCFLDFFGGVHGGDANVYVDETWKIMPPDFKLYYRTMRFNEFEPTHIGMVKLSECIEKVYIVGDRTGAPPISSTSSFQPPSSKADVDYITPEDSPSSAPGSTSVSASTATTATASTNSTNSTPDTRSSDRLATVASLGPLFLEAFTTGHGNTLQHFLLPPEWRLTALEVTDLVRACPNLTQLGVAFADDTFDTLRLILPVAPKLYALRILDPDGTRAMTTISDAEVAAFVGFAAYDHNATHLRWFGDFGRFWKIGRDFEAFCEDGSGRTEMCKIVRSVPKEEVADVEMWKLDTLDVMADRWMV